MSDVAPATADQATEVLKAWGDTLYMERHRQRLKQADVAERAGVDQKIVSRIESGKGSLASFLAIASALGVDLVGESE